VNEAVDSGGFGRFQWLLLIYVGMAWMSDALEMMLLSYLGPALRCEWGLTPIDEAAVTTVVRAPILSHCVKPYAAQRRRVWSKRTGAQHLVLAHLTRT
jgi:hypothetical protein